MARLEAVLSTRMAKPATVSTIRRLTGGATKLTYAFDALVDGERLPLILQFSTAARAPDPAVAHTPRLNAAEDAVLMRAARQAGVDAPRVVTVLDSADGLGAGHITERVDAEADGRRIVREPAFEQARAAFATDCGRLLARIHRMPPPVGLALQTHGAQAQIDGYEAVVQRLGIHHPALTYGFAWARRNAPTAPALTVVHGDFRMGNLMVDARGVRCVLDWEAAHLGDPLQDLGYLSVRSWRFGGTQPVGGVGRREDLVAAYRAAGGGPVDPRAVRFWEAWGNLKWAVVALRKGLQAVATDGPPELEQAAIGRRMEEPLWDFFQLLKQEST